MLSPTTQQSLTRRGSKQLVQMIIGVIGLLGIMLSQVEVDPSRLNKQVVNKGEQAIGATVSKASAQIDWKALLF